MEKQTPNVKDLSKELVTLSARLLDLLDQARRQAAESTDAGVRRSGQEWANLAYGNISDDRTKLQAALREDNASALRHTAGEFAVLGRYVDDYDYSWFVNHQNLSDTVGAASKTGAAIVVALLAKNA